MSTHSNDSTEKAYDNDQSCVLRISAGKHSVLLAGDIGKSSEMWLIGQHADKLFTNLLVVPHHGSKSSSSYEFVAATLPDYAVFTAGYRNRFGHPKEEVLQRYADSGAELMRSDEDGAILVKMNVQSLQVERYRKTHRLHWTHASHSNCAGWGGRVCPLYQVVCRADTVFVPTVFPRGQTMKPSTHPA